MANTSTKADLVIYEEEFFSGIVELVEQYAEDINTHTRGAVNYVTENLKGDFEKRSFWDVGDLISDRDPTSTAPVNSSGMAQSELVAPKSNLRIGPVEATEDGFRKIGQSNETMSLVLGQQMGAEIAVEWLNRSLSAVGACLTKTAATHLDISDETVGDDRADSIVSPVALNRVLGKMGDRRGRVVCWVMHSEAYTELTEGYIVDKIDGVTDTVLYGGASPSLGLPVLITDSPALKDGDTFTILGLTQDAVRMIESEERTIGMNRVFGKENLTRIMQGELAFTTRVKGWSFSGAASPNAAALGNAANWTYVFNDVKSGAGVALTVISKFAPEPT